MHIGTVVAHWKSNSSITGSIFALYVQVLWRQNILRQYGNIFLTDQQTVLCAVELRAYVKFIAIENLVAHLLLQFFWLTFCMDMVLLNI